HFHNQPVTLVFQQPFPLAFAQLPLFLRRGSANSGPGSVNFGDLVNLKSCRVLCATQPALLVINRDGDLKYQSVSPRKIREAVPDGCLCLAPKLRNEMIYICGPKQRVDFSGKDQSFHAITDDFLVAIAYF